MRAMCGIAGLWDQRAQTNADALAQACKRMTDSMLHRGPDAGDVWCDPAAGLALGHRRLSIIDLSPAGAQPMVSSCGRFVISFNGEVYNFDELRPELEAKGRRFRGHSDTEVIVEGAAEWGVEATVKRLIGMFAMALWDRRDRVLYIVRDRLGIKPVYWAQFGETLIFGSELKALREHPGWNPAPRPRLLAAFLRLMYVPGPQTIYRGASTSSRRARSLIAAAKVRRPRSNRIGRWKRSRAQGQDARFVGSEDEVVEALDALLGEMPCAAAMIADVPLGARSWSGGIDPPWPGRADAGEQHGNKVRSFSIGFHEKQYNEAEHAKAVAAHLGAPTIPNSMSRPSMHSM